jgi:biopolymer transport protein ExbB
MLGIAIERLYSLRRKNIVNSDFLQNVRSQWDWQDPQKTLQLCNSFDNSLSRVLKVGLLRVGGKLDEIERAIEGAGQHEASLMNSNLRVLGAVANITPMMGLLGTVFGMIKAFNVISMSGVPEGLYWYLEVEACFDLAKIDALLNKAGIEKIKRTTGG